MCRLVEYFDENNGIAMWVEDGTSCPLFTCSDNTLRPYDSQQTQHICNNCRRVCVRCCKSLLKDWSFLKPLTPIYLRQVETSVHYSCPSIGDVVQFEVRGGVELLPPATRYFKTLMQRLDKWQNQQKPTASSEITLEPVIKEWGTLFSL